MGNQPIKEEQIVVNNANAEVIMNLNLFENG